MAIKKNIKRFLDYSVLDMYQNIRDRRLQEKARKRSANLFGEYIASNDCRKLQIGCGDNLLESWLNTDISGRLGTGYLNAGEKFPFEKNTLDYIYSEHVFEHLEIDQQMNMLEEACRVLKRKGIMRIATPNLDFLFKIYRDPQMDAHREYVHWAVNNSLTLRDVKNKIRTPSTHYCYVINNFFKAWGHQMVHNLESLEQIGLQAGFSTVRKCEVGKSEDPVLQGVEKHGEVIPEEMNLLETMVVELIK